MAEGSFLNPNGHHSAKLATEHIGMGHGLVTSGWPDHLRGKSIDWKELYIMLYSHESVIPLTKQLTELQALGIADAHIKQV